MKQRRVKIGVYAGLPIVREMITDTAIRVQLNDSCRWFSIKERREKMKPWQVGKINEAMWGIAERLAAVRIDYNDDRQQVIDQIKQHLKPVKLKYIYEKHFKKSVTWWSQRTMALYGNGYGYSFTEEDILKINLAIADIVNRLLSIELVAEEEF